MKVSLSNIILYGTAAAVVICAVIYVRKLINDSNEPSDPLFVSADVDFFSYYENAKSGSEDYTVTDVYMRSENNFLQGLYFDKDTRLFYESAGLYG